MAALALRRPELWLPRLDVNRLFKPKPLRLDGQFAPGQRLQMLDNAPGVGVDRAPLTFSLVHTATGSDTTIEIPAAGATAAVGDLAICWNHSHNSAPPAPTSVTALATSIREDSGTASRAIISGEILESGDLNTAKTGINGSQFERWILAIFRPSVPISAFAVNSAVGEQTDGNPTSKTITSASAATLPIIALGHWCSGSAVSPRTCSPAMQEIAGATTAQYAGYEIINASPSDYSIDIDDEGFGNAVQGAYLTFTLA